MQPNKENILLLSTADWDNPFWTNKQHVALELSRLGHKVFYVDSIGLRSPSINKSDISRIFRRLLKGLKFPKKINENLWVWSPVVVPFQKYRAVRELNKWTLYFFSKLFLFLLGFKSPVLWSYNPMTLDIYPVWSGTRVVYHCVDDIKEQPGMPVSEIESAEKRLFKRANYVFVTSEKLYGVSKPINNNTFLFSNVADYEHFSQARNSMTVVPGDIARIKKPIIGFVGAISSYKVDFDLLSFIAKARPDWSIVLIGKIGEGDPDTDVTSLEFDNIHFLGPRAYEKLPAYLKGFDVAMIPVVLNDYTHAMFPMKFFEYLAAGNRVISTDIDSLKSYGDYLYIASSYDEFVSGIDEILSSKDDSDRENRLALARQNTYKTRTEKMLAVMNGLSE
ncbi:MAG: glycosyltransferase [Methylococcales bacterium]